MGILLERVVDEVRDVEGVRHVIVAAILGLFVGVFASLLANSALIPWVPLPISFYTALAVGMVWGLMGGNFSGSVGKGVLKGFFSALGLFAGAMATFAVASVLMPV